MVHPDVMHFPELDEICVFEGAAPGDESEQTFHEFFSVEDALDI